MLSEWHESRRKIRVLLHIIFNKELSQNLRSFVRVSIWCIKGVEDCFFTPSSKVSDLVIISRWKPSDILENLEKIRKIEGIEKVEDFTFV